MNDLIQLPALINPFGPLSEATWDSIKNISKFHYIRTSKRSLQPLQCSVMHILVYEIMYGLCIGAPKKKIRTTDFYIQFVYVHCTLRKVPILNLIFEYRSLIELIWKHLLKPICNFQQYADIKFWLCIFHICIGILLSSWTMKKIGLAHPNKHKQNPCRKCHANVGTNECIFLFDRSLF